MLAIACMISVMMREYEYCLDTCSLYVSGDTYIRRKIWMDGDGYRGKDTRPHTKPYQVSLCIERTVFRKNAQSSVKAGDIFPFLK
jgi:hypothetical protein